MERRGISLAYSELHDKVGMAKLAEQANYANIWNSGSSIPGFAAMLTATDHAKIGSGVLHGFSIDARNLAGYCTDLQQISNNRFVLGIGGGTKRMNLNFLGQLFDKPAARLRELVKILQLYWATPQGEPVKYEGTYNQIAGRGLKGPTFGGPDLGKTPIYLAAVNRPIFRLAGELCDGLCGHPIASVPFIQNVAWPEIDEGLRRAGRTRESFDHASWIVTAISQDRQQALRELKFHIGRFFATRSYAVVLDSQGLESVRLGIQDAFFNHPGDMEKLIERVPDEVAYLHGIAGTPDEVREQAKRYTGVVDTPTFYCASFSMSKERIKENLLSMIETFGQ